ncbi:uncharacterized protein LOC115628704 isoform X2 [Scaptodrosophila lebanonensis]|uniref:Uncharacterized protein LOC115628704 isoform X2 n=2 Tax=Drosophila lebanonensis TaxID=7225 RepID=A0A6J2TW20_DROLE|nr:uncharacterized protein LOC115628704 isoform X2 [Scaptodrosophila lebanonensis]
MGKYGTFHLTDCPKPKTRYDGCMCVLVGVSMITGKSIRAQYMSKNCETELPKSSAMWHLMVSLETAQKMSTQFQRKQLGNKSTSAIRLNSYYKDSPQKTTPLKRTRPKLVGYVSSTRSSVGMPSKPSKVGSALKLRSKSEAVNNRQPRHLQQQLLNSVNRNPKDPTIGPNNRSSNIHNRMLKIKAMVRPNGELIKTTPRAIRLNTFYRTSKTQLVPCAESCQTLAPAHSAQKTFQSIAEMIRQATNRIFQSPYELQEEDDVVDEKQPCDCEGCQANQIDNIVDPKCDCKWCMANAQTQKSDDSPPCDCDFCQTLAEENPTEDYPPCNCDYCKEGGSADIIGQESEQKSDKDFNIYSCKSSYIDNPYNANEHNSNNFECNCKDCQAAERDFHEQEQEEGSNEYMESDSACPHTETQWGPASKLAEKIKSFLSEEEKNLKDLCHKFNFLQSGEKEVVEPCKTQPKASIKTMAATSYKASPTPTEPNKALSLNQRKCPESDSLQKKFHTRVYEKPRYYHMPDNSCARQTITGHSSQKTEKLIKDPQQRKDGRQTITGHSSQKTEKLIKDQQQKKDDRQTVAGKSSQKTENLIKDQQQKKDDRQTFGGHSSQKTDKLIKDPQQKKDGNQSVSGYSSQKTEKMIKDQQQKKDDRQTVGGHSSQKTEKLIKDPQKKKDDRQTIAGHSSQKTEKLIKDQQQKKDNRQIAEGHSSQKTEKLIKNQQQKNDDRQTVGGHCSQKTEKLIKDPQKKKDDRQTIAGHSSQKTEKLIKDQQQKRDGTDIVRAVRSRTCDNSVPKRGLSTGREGVQENKDGGDTDATLNINIKVALDAKEVTKALGKMRQSCAEQRTTLNPVAENRTIEMTPKSVSISGIIAPPTHGKCTELAEAPLEFDANALSPQRESSRSRSVEKPNNFCLDADSESKRVQSLKVLNPSRCQAVKVPEILPNMAPENDDNCMPRCIIKLEPIIELNDEPMSHKLAPETVNPVTRKDLHGCLERCSMLPQTLNGVSEGKKKQQDASTTNTLGLPKTTTTSREDLRALSLGPKRGSWEDLLGLNHRLRKSHITSADPQTALIAFPTKNIAPASTDKARPRFPFHGSTTNDGNMCGKISVFNAPADSIPNRVYCKKSAEDCREEEDADMSVDLADCPSEEDMERINQCANALVESLTTGCVPDSPVVRDIFKTTEALDKFINECKKDSAFAYILPQKEEKPVYEEMLEDDAYALIDEPEPPKDLMLDNATECNNAGISCAELCYLDSDDMNNVEYEDNGNHDFLLTAEAVDSFLNEYQKYADSLSPDNDQAAESPLCEMIPSNLQCPENEVTVPVPETKSKMPVTNIIEHTKISIKGNDQEAKEQHHCAESEEQEAKNGKDLAHSPKAMPQFLSKSKGCINLQMGVNSMVGSAETKTVATILQNDGQAVEITIERKVESSAIESNTQGD